MLLATTTILLCVLIGQSYAARHQLSSHSKALNLSERPHLHRRHPIHEVPLPIHSVHSVETVKIKPVARRNESVNVGALHWSVPSKGPDEGMSNPRLPGFRPSRRMKRHRRLNLGVLHWSVLSRGPDEAPFNPTLPGSFRLRRMKRRVKHAARKKELLPPPTSALPATVAAGGVVPGEGNEAEDIVTTPPLVAIASTKKTRTKTTPVPNAGGSLGNATEAPTEKVPGNKHRHSNASTSSNETLEAPVAGVGEGEPATEPGEGDEAEAAAAAGDVETTVSTKSAKRKGKKGKATTIQSLLEDGEPAGEEENGEISFNTEKPSNQKTNSFGFPIEDIPANGVFEDQKNTSGPNQFGYGTPMGYGQFESNESAIMHLETTTHEHKSPTLLIVAAVVVSLVGVVAILVIGMVMYRYRAEIFGKGQEAPKPPTETAPLKTEKKPSDKGLKTTKNVASNVGLVLKNDVAAKPGAPPGPGAPPNAPGVGPVPPGGGAAPGVPRAFGAAPGATGATGAAPGTAGAPNPLSAFGTPTKLGITPSAPMAGTGAAPSTALKPDGTPIGAQPAVPASTAAPSMATSGPASTSANSAASSAQSDISGSVSTGASSGSNISSAKS